MRKPKAVLHDLGGTIAKLRAFDIPKGQARLYELADNPRDVPFDIVRQTADPLAESLFGRRDETLMEYPLNSFNRLLYERFGMSFPLEPHELELEFWKAVCTFTAEPGIEDALKAIKDRGLPLSIISNASFHEDVLWWELQRLGLAQHFDFIMSSADYGCRKPHPAIFQAAVGRLNISARHVWYIGDTPEHDVEGSQGVGIQAVWYNARDRRAPHLMPQATIMHWSELAPLIDGSR